MGRGRGPVRYPPRRPGHHHLVILAIEVNVTVGTGRGAVPLNLTAHLLGAALALPILFRHRYPFQVMLATAVLIFFYYIFARRNISPAPLFAVPFYDAAVAGYLAWGAAIGVGFMVTGLFVVEISTRAGLATLASDFPPQIAVLALGAVRGVHLAAGRADAGHEAELPRRVRAGQGDDGVRQLRDHGGRLRAGVRRAADRRGEGLAGSPGADEPPAATPAADPVVAR